MWSMETELHTPLTGVTTTGFSGTVAEKLQHPGIIWKHSNSLHKTKENIEHFQDDTGR